MRILGIDPGLTGGAAILAIRSLPQLPLLPTTPDPNPSVLDAIDIPTRGEEAKRRVDVLALSNWIVNWKPDVAFIERAQAMPEQGASSGFIYGRAVGALEAAAILANVPLHVIEPRAWKKHFGLKGGDKEGARQMLIRGLPSAAKYVERKKDHGLAEATLIAMYGADLIADGFDWHGHQPSSDEASAA